MTARVIVRKGRNGKGRCVTAHVKAIRKELPVVVLATDPSTLTRLQGQEKPEGVDRIFLWQNDPTLLVAIIKYFEDMANVDRDTRVGGVRLVLLVEDSIAHYSTFLPAIYTAIMVLTRRLIDEGLNHLHRQLRMRSRAKILLAGSFEEAVEIYRRYRPFILGVITDVRFMKAGRLDDDAGFELVRMLRRDMPELPICIQSAEPDQNRSRAGALQTYFIDKNSSRLMEDLQRVLREYMGFGDFIFRMRGRYSDSLALIHIERGAYGEEVRPGPARAAALVVILPYLALVALFVLGLARLRAPRRPS